MDDRGRAATYDRRRVPALYDVDIRLTSRLLWGASVASQAELLAVLLDDSSVLDVPAGTGLITAKALRGRPETARVVAVEAAGMVTEEQAAAGTLLQWIGHRNP